ncbi:MAG TPA: TetR/AcrR family transcriptional regulator [Conexibacter sp.]|jgi:AcrR family transcriptional regulator
MSPQTPSSPRKPPTKSDRPTQLSARGTRTRELILRAAIEVFGRQGFADATMLHIAQEAGVASGTVYQYFSDKADVFRYLLRDLERKLHRETRMPAGSDGRLVVRDSVLRYLAVYREHEALFRAWWELLEPPTEFTDAWVALHRKSHGELRAVVEQGQRDGTIARTVDADIAAELIVAMFERPAYLRIILGWDSSLTDDEFAGALEHLLRGGLLPGLAAGLTV